MKSECRRAGIRNQESVISNQSSQKNEEIRTQNGNTRFIIHHSSFCLCFPFQSRLCGEKKRQKDEVRMQGSGDQGIRGSGIRNQESGISHRKKNEEIRTKNGNARFIIHHSSFCLCPSFQSRLCGNYVFYKWL